MSRKIHTDFSQTYMQIADKQNISQKLWLRLKKTIDFTGSV